MLNALLIAAVIVAHEPGYTTSLANHLQRWLNSEDIAARVISPDGMAAGLKGERLAFLVGFNEPGPAELSALTEFHNRGGKMVVFHSSSAELGRLMGVKPLGFKTAAYPGQWSRMDFIGGPMGRPDSILQTSTVLQRAEPAAGSKAEVIAFWTDRRGRSTGDAAWIASPGGYWMTHVLLADGDEHLKQLLVASIVGACDFGKWDYARYLDRERRKDAAFKGYAKQQTPVKGELHAVWDHSGCGLYPGDWARTMKALREARVTDLFVNVAGAGFAHYASGVLPRSKTFLQEGDQLAACLKAAQGTGVRVHAWILCFNATRAAPERLAAFRRDGWCLNDRNGRRTEYLDPSNFSVRAHILAAITEIAANYRVDGVHLDFIRWYERSVKPPDAAAKITSFVQEARRRIGGGKWLTTAVLGKYPSCLASVGQDWPSWIDRGIVDYVVPMDYTEDMVKFESLLKQHAGDEARARRTIVGLGVTANESRLDARQVIDQIRLVRKYRLAGEALFDLDTFLEKKVIPYLKLGVW